MPGQIHAQAQTQNPVVQEVRQTIQAGYTYTAENLKDQPNGYSADGSMEFWSSGGLRNMVAAGYASFGLMRPSTWSRNTFW